MKFSPNICVFFRSITPPHKKTNGLILSLFNCIVVILNTPDGKKDEIPSEMFAHSVKTTTLHKLVVIYRGIDMVTCEEIQ